MPSSSSRNNGGTQRSYRAQQRWYKIQKLAAVYRAASVAHGDITTLHHNDSSNNRRARNRKTATPKKTYHPSHPEALKQQALASSSTNNSGLSEVVWTAKVEMGLRAGMINSECAYLNVLDEMKVHEKMDLVFETAFGGSDGTTKSHVNLNDLQTVLDALQMDGTIKNDIPPAETMLEIFTSTPKSQQQQSLSKADVESLIHGLSALAIDCPFNEMCQLIIRATLFQLPSAHILDEQVQIISGQSKCNAEHATTEARTIFVFKALEHRQSGYVYLKDVVKSLYRITQDMGEMERESLLMLQDKSLRKLDYELFSDILHNVAQHFRNVPLMDLINEITLAFSTESISDEEIKHLFVCENNALNDSMESFDSVSSSESCYSYHQTKARGKATANLAAWMGFSPTTGRKGSMS